jgi:hypothetical protein
LIGTVPALTTTAIEFAADGTAVSAQQSSDLADGLVGFQEAMNL